MFNIRTHLWASPWPKMFRSVVWVFLIGAFMAMNESHAQECTGTPVIRTTQSLPPTMAYSFVNQTKILGSYEATVTLSGCSGFNTTKPLPIFIAYTGAMFGGENITVNGTQYNMSGERVGCFINGYCFDSGDAVAKFTNELTGISHEFTAQINGLDNLSKECVAPLTNTGSNLSGLVPGLVGTWRLKPIQINFSNTTSACSKITIKVTGRIIQTARFYLSNVDTILLKTAGDASDNFRFVIGGSTANQLANFDLISVPATLISQAGTCALSLSTTALNMGNFTLAQVSAISPGTAVSTKPLAITIGNCTGFPIGLNKVLQWTFANPSADQTQMSNGTVQGRPRAYQPKFWLTKNSLWMKYPQPWSQTKSKVVKITSHPEKPAITKP